MFATAKTDIHTHCRFISLPCH